MHLYELSSWHNLRGLESRINAPSNVSEMNERLKIFYDSKSEYLMKIKKREIINI